MSGAIRSLQLTVHGLCLFSCFQPGAALASLACPGLFAVDRVVGSTRALMGGYDFGRSAPGRKNGWMLAVVR